MNVCTCVGFGALPTDTMSAGSHAILVDTSTVVADHVCVVAFTGPATAFVPENTEMPPPCPSVVPLLKSVVRPVREAFVGEPA